MSDTQVVPTGTDLLSTEAMGHFDEDGVYIPRSITEDDLGGGSLEDAMAGTIVEFEDGDLVQGTVVKIDRDEVLLDIGFKSEGVIPVVSCPFATMSIRPRSSPWVRPSRPWFSRRRTRRVA